MYYKFSIEREPFPPVQNFNTEQWIKYNSWEELADFLQANCPKHIIQDLYPSTANLSTKTFVDKLAIHSLKRLFNEKNKRCNQLQKQIDSDNATKKSLIVKQNDLQKQLASVELKINEVDAKIQRNTKDLSYNTRGEDKIETNLKIYQAALVKNESALKKFQQQLKSGLNQWSCDNISALLKEIGLGSYSGSFLTNSIDGTVLQQLDTNDLITLKVSFKDAKKLLMYLHLIQTHHDIYVIPPGVLQWNNDTVCTWLEDNKFAHLTDTFKKHQVRSASYLPNKLYENDKCLFHRLLAPSSRS